MVKGRFADDSWFLLPIGMATTVKETLSDQVVRNYDPPKPRFALPSFRISQRVSNSSFEVPNLRHYQIQSQTRVCKCPYPTCRADDHSILARHHASRFCPRGPRDRLTQPPATGIQRDDVFGTGTQ